jgi:hypothetical protein
MREANGEDLGYASLDSKHRAMPSRTKVTITHRDLTALTKNAAVLARRAPNSSPARSSSCFFDAMIWCGRTLSPPLFNCLRRPRFSPAHHRCEGFVP